MLDKENFNLKKQKTKKILLVAIIALVVAILLISVSMAYYKRVVQGAKKYVITAGVDANITLTLNETSNDITIDNAIPQKDEEGKTNSAYTFSLKNRTSSTTYRYTIYLEDNEIEDGATRVGDDFIKYYLTNDGLNTQKEPALLSSLETDENGRILETGIIQGSGTTHNYALRFWVDYDATIEDVAGKAFSVRLNIIATEATFFGNLESTLDTTTVIDFTQISSETNGRGIYKYQEDGEDIYYWRGKVDEVEGAANHVLFANLCWEIVRTTKTGGVKMIYDGEPVYDNGRKTCPNTGTASQLKSPSVFNNQNLQPLAYVGYMYGNTVYEWNHKEETDAALTSVGVLYGNDVEWTGTDYVLKAKEGESLFSSTGSWSTDKTSVGNGNHYTCFNVEGKCETVSYVYYAGRNDYIFYVELTEGITIEQALEQTYSNEHPSTIKTTIETWFESTDLDDKENLSKLEDVVYCNDRSVTDTNHGWNKEGNGIMDYSSRTRRSNGTPDLSCSGAENNRDRFTYKDTVNGNGLLKWPVGLLTGDEIILAGGQSSINKDYYLHTGENYWTLSPGYVGVEHSGQFFVNAGGTLFDSHLMEATHGVRPVITLSSKVQITGVGTESYPYTVN